MCDIEEAQELIQATSQHIQLQVHKSINGLVTRCIQSVYGTHILFQILFERKRNKTEARMIFVVNGHEENPKSVPGGWIDVAAFGLRIAQLILERPQHRFILVLDEPFKNVNGEVYQNRVGSMIQALSQELKIQFVVVTDDSWLKIPTVHEF